MDLRFPLPTRRWRVVFLVVALLLLSSVAGASPSWALRDVLVPELLHPIDQFGRSVAIDGSTIVVGAPGDDTTANGAGAVFLYELQEVSVSFVEKLVPSDLQPLDGFGSEVAIDGDMLAVGTAGAGVYVFVREAGGWKQRGQLVYKVGCTGQVAVQGQYVAVGCPESQMVHVFLRDGEAWLEQVLLALAPSAGSFGRSVALRGDWLAVGDPDDAELSASSGALALYRREGASWTLADRVTWPASAHPAGGEFGHCVDLQDGKLLVSAPSARFPSGSWGGGRSYRLVSNLWEVDTTFQNLGKAEDLFGYGCALYGDWVAFGAPEAQSARGDVHASGVDSAGRGPLESLDTVNSLGANLAGARFGTNLDMDGSHMIVGAPSAQSFGLEAGAAFVYTLVDRAGEGSPCSHAASCQSGYCVDGVCCNAPCNTPCVACSANTKGGGVDGICGVVPAGFDPKDDCERDDSPCGSDGTCDGLGACRQFATAVTPCGSTRCEGGRISGPLCSGTGECVDERLASCAPYLCMEGGCSTQCDVDADCAPNARCSNRRCLSSASCDGDHTLLLPDGRKLDCSPYKCSIDGTCEQFCNRVQDCVAPYVCNRRLACVTPEPPASAAPGCGCRAVGTLTASSLPASMLASIALVALLSLRRRRRVIVPLLALCLFGSKVSWASSWAFQEMLTSPGPLAFGTSVALEGDRLVVGAPGALGGSAEAGAVYSFRRMAGRWNLDQTVLCSLPDCVGFGKDLAVASDTLAVRCANGVVEIFQLESDRWVSRKTRALPSGWDFGSMGLSADWLVLGNYRQVPSNLGALLLLARSGGAWDTEQTIAPQDDTAEFGSFVALRDTGLLASGVGPQSGSVRFLTVAGQTWSEAVAVQSPASDPWSQAPRLAADGATALIGPSRSDPEIPKVDVFRLTSGSWQWEAALSPPTPSREFGATLAVEGTTAVVGAPDVGKKDPETGALFVFQSDGSQWSHDATLEPPDAVSVSGFGSVVALEGNLAVVGVPDGASSVWELGLVFIFARGEVVGVAEPCLADELCESGHCVDGVCCATACEGVCEACSSEAKGGGEDGVCGPVAAGKDPRHDCRADPGFPASCGADGMCDGSGHCRTLSERGTPCGPTTCDQGLLQGRTCDGFGVCLEDSLVACNPYQCDGDRCGSGCGETTDCALGAVCSAFGVCLVTSQCDGNHTVILDTGETRDCHPYVCQPNGTCLETCNSVVQCVAPFVCDRSYRCVELKETPEEDADCWCAMPRRPVGVGAWLWVGWVLGLAALRRWTRRERFILRE